MSRLRVILTISISVFISAGGHTQKPVVFQINASGCGESKIVRKSSGFIYSADEKYGILTSLHGLCGCEKFKAFDSENNRSYRNLYMEYIDIENDIALLSSEEISRARPKAYTIPSKVPWDKIKGKNALVYGYGLGMRISKENSVRIREVPLQQFAKVLDAAAVIDRNLYSEMRERNSPSFTIKVIDIDGSIVPGLSGGPIIYENVVIGVSNGGIGGGALPYNWGIPIDEINLEPFTNSIRVSRPYTILSKNVEQLFSNITEEDRRIIRLVADHSNEPQNQKIYYEIFFNKPIEKGNPINAQIIIQGEPTNTGNIINYKSEILLEDGDVFKGKINIPGQLPLGLYEFILFTGKNEYLTEFVVN